MSPSVTGTAPCKWWLSIYSYTYPAKTYPAVNMCRAWCHLHDNRISQVRSKNFFSLTTCFEQKIFLHHRFPAVVQKTILILVNNQTKGSHHKWVSQVALEVKNLPASAGDVRIPTGSGRSPGWGHGNPLQDSYLENPHGQRSLAGLQSIGPHKVWHNKHLSTHAR